ncbi:MAG: hypothetical protein EBS48_10760 [Actinobacteria bacterium]|nr:hypothetical protein [Actinomycetota bacterium]
MQDQEREAAPTTQDHEAPTTQEQLLRNLGTQIAKVATLVEQHREESRDRHNELQGRVRTLEVFTFGSKPPPRPGSIPDAEWLEDAAKASPDSPALVPTLARIERKTDEQSSYLGMGAKGLAKLVATPNGRNAIIGIMVAIAAWLGGKASTPATAPAPPRIEVIRVEVPQPDAGSTGPLGSR